MRRSGGGLGGRHRDRQIARAGKIEHRSGLLVEHVPRDRVVTQGGNPGLPAISRRVGGGERHLILQQRRLFVALRIDTARVMDGVKHKIGRDGEQKQRDYHCAYSPFHEAHRCMEAEPFKS